MGIEFEHSASEDVGSEPLLSVALIAGLLPVGGTVRSEILVGVFASAIASIDPTGVLPIRGHLDELALRQLCDTHRWVRSHNTDY